LTRKEVKLADRAPTIAPSKEEQQKLIGLYTSKDPPFEVRVVWVEGQLRAGRGAKGYPLPLIPLTRTRFKLDNHRPGEVFLEFNLSGAKVKSLTLRSAKWPTITLLPKK
jgi:hypothetical protein